MKRILYWLFSYATVYNAVKPVLVWLYIKNDGDQEKIREFITNCTNPDYEVIKRDLKYVKLKNYVSLIDFGKEKYFEKYKNKLFVIEKKDFKLLKAANRLLPNK